MEREKISLESERPHVIHIAWESGGEFFAMSIARGREREALRTLGRWASDPEILLCWSDAANISNQIRRAFR